MHNMQTSTKQIKSLAFYIAIFLIVWMIRATVLYPIDKSIASPELEQIYSDAFRIVIWVIPVFAYISQVDNRNPLAYLRLNTPGNKKAVLQTGMVALLYFAIILLVDFLRAGVSSRFIFSPLLFSNSWLKTILMITIAPIAEEILYRGFFLQKFQEIGGPWKANLITSCLFVAIHLPNWVYTGKALLEIATASVSIFILSLLLGYLLQKTKSLYPSIAVHMLNNLISFYIHFG